MRRHFIQNHATLLHFSEKWVRAYLTGWSTVVAYLRVWIENFAEHSAELVQTLPDMTGKISRDMLLKYLHECIAFVMKLFMNIALSYF